MPARGILSASGGGGGGGGGILSARGGDSKCPGHLESPPPLALRVPLEVSTAFRYLQLTNQIARITSAIV